MDGRGVTGRRSGLAGELRHGILNVAAGEPGIAAPFAYLIAGVGSLCLASVIIRFTRRMASAGGLDTPRRATSATGSL